MNDGNKGSRAAACPIPFSPSDIPPARPKSSSRADVELVVDVRTVPRSRTNPQFNRDVLPASLGAHGIAYEHFTALGGLRGIQRDIPPAANAFWENASFHNFADYAMSEGFRSGLGNLRELGRAAPAAVMCAESPWWRMPSPHHCGLSHSGGRGGLPHSRPQPHRASAFDARGPAWSGWDADLSEGNAAQARPPAMNRA